jgi:guanylate kinase
MKPELLSKELVMIVGPTAIGKSTLMNHVMEMDRDFGRVSGFTSRPARENDEPGMYRYVTADEASVIANSAETIQYVLHPTTGIMYGTQVQDYPAKYNLLDTLSDVVEELRDLPFRRTTTISLTTDAESWERWLHDRYPVPSLERKKRLQEAINSIEWSLRQTSNHHWIINRPDKIDDVANQLILAVKTSSNEPTDVPPEARRLREIARTLLSYE